MSDDRNNIYNKIILDFQLKKDDLKATLNELNNEVKKSMRESTSGLYQNVTKEVSKLQKELNTLSTVNKNVTHQQSIGSKMIANAKKYEISLLTQEKLLINAIKKEKEKISNSDIKGKPVDDSNLRKYQQALVEIRTEMERLIRVEKYRENYKQHPTNIIGPTSRPKGSNILSESFGLSQTDFSKNRREYTDLSQRMSQVMTKSSQLNGTLSLQKAQIDRTASSASTLKQRYKEISDASANLNDTFKKSSSYKDFISASGNALLTQAKNDVKQYNISLKESLRYLQALRRVEMGALRSARMPGGIGEENFDRTRLDVLNNAIGQIKTTMAGTQSKFTDFFANLFAGTRFGARFNRMSNSVKELGENAADAGAMGEEGMAAFSAMAGKVALGVTAILTVMIPLIKLTKELVKVLLNFTKEFIISGYELNKQLEITRVALSGMFGSTQDANSFISSMREMATQMGTSYEETINIARRLIPYSNANEETLRNMVILGQQLALSNPKAGLDSAALALVEAYNGEMTSLRRTFNLNTDAIRVWYQEFERTGDLNTYIKQMQDYMTTIGYSNDLVLQFGDTFQGTLNKLKLSYENFAMALARPVMEVLNRQLKELVEYLDDSSDSITYGFVRLGATIAVVTDRVIELVKSFGPAIIRITRIMWRISSPFQSISGGARLLKNAIDQVRISFELLYFAVFGKIIQLPSIMSFITGSMSSDIDFMTKKIYTALTDLSDIELPEGLNPDTGIFDKVLEAEREISDAVEDYQENLEESAIDHQEKMQEIIDDAIEDRKNAYEKYLEDIADIEEEYQEDLQEEKEQYNEKIEDIEQDHVDKLLEIRQKYMDQLFDAVNARDARRVFEIMRDMNRELADENQQADKKRKEAQEDYQEELEDLKEARDKRLEELRESYLKELEEINKKEKEALADEIKSYEKRLAELKRSLDKQIESIIQRWVREGIITREQTMAIQAYIQDHYGIMLNLQDTYNKQYLANEEERARLAELIANGQAISGSYIGTGGHTNYGGSGGVTGGGTQTQKPTIDQVNTIAKKLYALNSSLGSYLPNEAANDVFFKASLSKLSKYNLSSSLMSTLQSLLASNNFMSAYSILSNALTSMLASGSGSYLPGGVRPMAGGLDVVVTRPTLFQAGEGGPERVMGIPLGARSALSKNTGTTTTIVHKVDGNGISKEMEALIAYQIGRATGQAVVGYTRSRRR